MQGAFPPELALEPADVEQLYDSMHSAVQAALPAAGGDGGADGTDGWAAQVGRGSPALHG